MNPVPGAANEENRLTQPDPAFDEFIFLASQICGTPLSFISLVDDRCQSFKARQGLSIEELPGDNAFCAHTIMQDDVMVVVDASCDERFRDNPLVLGEPFVRFYAGSPLVTPQGCRLGILAVMDHRPRELSQPQIRALDVLSRKLVRELELRMMAAPHQQAEHAARTLNLALEGASVGVWDWDLRTDRVDFDQRWCAMLGLEYEQTEMHLKTWERLVHADDLSACYQDIQDYMDGKTDRYENIHRMRHANGDWIYIFDRGRISEWDEHGKPTRFTGTHLDISAHEKRKVELQEARRRLEEAEIAGRFGSWEHDLITGVSSWSRGLNLIFEFDPDQTVPSFDVFLTCLVPDDHQRMMTLYDDLLAGRVSSFETDYRIRTKSGQLRYLQAFGQVQCDEHQQPVAILGTVQDTTSLKLMELSLIASREEAITATKTKSRFLASMSHEIRTPLNGIICNTTLLLETDLSSEQRDMTATIKSSSDALLSLIDDILDFSKIEAGKLDIESVPFDIRTTVGDAVKVVSKRAEEKAIDLEIAVDQAVPAIIVSDPYRFRQILLNLLSNAVKFTDQGKVRLEIGHSLLANNRVLILVAVQDSGIGMSPDQQEKLFKDFTQADESTTRKYGGTGLGLAICKQLCSLLGGGIEVQSELGKGSRFSFRIEAALGNSLTPVNFDQSPPCEPFALSKAKALRVLVAEDNQVNQAIAVQYLKKLNVSADLVDNGQAAVDAVKRQVYDIVFMDVHMPILDGYDATRKIRAELPADHQPYVVALTANAMKEDKESCLAAGMDDFLKKPLGLPELTISVSKFFTARSVSQASYPSAAHPHFTGTCS